MKKKDVRIIERTSPDGRVRFVIQQKHFLFRWWWVDASTNSFGFADCEDSFHDLTVAKRHLCYFDGTPTTVKVVE